LSVSRAMADCEAPPIAAVPAGVQRPLWSVMIPTFNCAKYLRLTLESVLSQAPGPDDMQIEVVDDCSTKDDPEAVVKEMGKGRVLFHRKPQNGGAIANFNTCIERSHGHLIHILHGDDVVLPKFYSRLSETAEAHPDLAMIGSRSFDIDIDGIISGVSDRLLAFESGSRDASSLFYSNPIKTPSIVIRRAFYELHGGFLLSLIHCADWEMWARASGHGGAIIVPDVLCKYRLFPGNDTSRLARSADNLRDFLRYYGVMAARHADFDQYRAKSILIHLSRQQADKFRVNGDTEAYAHNLAFYKSIVPFYYRFPFVLPRALLRYLKRGINRLARLR